MFSAVPDHTCSQSSIPTGFNGGTSIIRPTEQADFGAVAVYGAACLSAAHVKRQVCRGHRGAPDSRHHRNTTAVYRHQPLGTIPVS